MTKTSIRKNPTKCCWLRTVWYQSDMRRHNWSGETDQLLFIDKDIWRGLVAWMVWAPLLFPDTWHANLETAQRKSLALAQHVVTDFAVLQHALWRPGNISACMVLGWPKVHLCQLSRRTGDLLSAPLAKTHSVSWRAELLWSCFISLLCRADFSQLLICSW